MFALETVISDIAIHGGDNTHNETRFTAEQLEDLLVALSDDAFARGDTRAGHVLEQWARLSPLYWVADDLYEAGYEKGYADCLQDLDP